MPARRRARAARKAARAERAKAQVVPTTKQDQEEAAWELHEDPFRDWCSCYPLPFTHEQAMIEYHAESEDEVDSFVESHNACAEATKLWLDSRTKWR